MASIAQEIESKGIRIDTSLVKAVLQLVCFLHVAQLLDEGVDRHCHVLPRLVACVVAIPDVNRASAAFRLSNDFRER